MSGPSCSGEINGSHLNIQSPEVEEGEVTENHLAEEYGDAMMVPVKEETTLGQEIPEGEVVVLDQDMEHHPGAAPNVRFPTTMLEIREKSADKLEESAQCPVCSNFLSINEIVRCCSNVSHYVCLFCLDVFRGKCGYCATRTTKWGHSK